MPDLNSFTYGDNPGTSVEDFQRMLAEAETPPAAVEPPPAPAEVPPPEAPAEAAPAADAETTPPATPEAEPPRRGNPEVPLRQARERVRQLESTLNDPEALLQQLLRLGYQPQQAEAQAPPSVLEDEAGAIQHYVQQAIQPYQEQLAQATSFIQQLQREQQMAQVRQQFSGLGDVDGRIAQFDEELPEFAHLPPTLKLLAIQGHQAMDPTKNQALIQAEAEKLALAMTQKALANNGGRAAAPPTLGGIPPAQAAQGLPDISQMSNGDIQGLSLEQMQRIARGGG